MYQDEVHFSVEATITRKWCKKGSQPKVRSYPGRKSVAYSGFVVSNDGTLFVSKPDWFNYETTIASVRDFISNYKLKEGQKLYIIMDNAPWHKKALRLIQDEANTEYNDIREKATFVSLPPYSPDYNPIEQVWRITRREKTHNKYWPSLPVLIETLDGWFKGFAKPNDKLRTLCSFS